MSNQNNHQTSGMQDTGHVWDDNLRELTNPPPNWWTIGFYASIAFVAIYGIIYPMIPLLESHTKGLLGWTSIQEYKQGLGEVQARREQYEKKLEGMTVQQILADQDMKTYTVNTTKVFFGDKCAACHGSNGQGNPGFPVLADDDWLWGGTVDKIEATISNGRKPMMPAHSKVLSQSEADTLVKYVTGLSQGKTDPEGQKLFQGKGCFACHGQDGKGNQAMGAANLTDSIWRFSGTEEGIRYTIVHGVNDPSDKESRNAVMPTFKNSLSATEIKKLAVYAHEFGGGQ